MQAFPTQLEIALIFSADGSISYGPADFQFASNG